MSSISQTFGAQGRGAEKIFIRSVGVLTVAGGSGTVGLLRSPKNMGKFVPVKLADGSTSLGLVNEGAFSINDPVGGDYMLNCSAYTSGALFAHIETPDA